MSECGRCPKSLTYKYLGYTAAEAPAWLMTSAREGKLHEEWLLGELASDDIAVYGGQDTLRIEQPLFTLEGHIDSYESDHGIDRVVECKSLSQGEYQRWSTQGLEAFPHWAAQITAYMTATGLPCRLIVKNRNTGTTHGLDPCDTAYFFSITPVDFASIVTRLNDVAECIQNEQLYEGVSYDPDRLECKRCAYQALCIPPPPVLAEDQEAELAQAVVNYREGKAMADAGSELVDKAREVFRAYAESIPNKQFMFMGLAARVYPVEFTSYPKAEVEQLIAPDVLKRIAKVTRRYDLRVTDKDADNGD